MPSCLSNQLSLLMLLAVRSEVTTRELALSLGITERAVHRILRDLAESGYLTIGKRGYRNQYTVHPEVSVGHPVLPDADRSASCWRRSWRGRLRTARNGTAPRPHSSRPPDSKDHTSQE